MVLYGCRRGRAIVQHAVIALGVVTIALGGTRVASADTSVEAEAADVLYEELLAQERDRNSATDTVTLTNGRVLRGRVLEQTGSGVQFETPTGIKMRFAKAQVATVEFGEPTPVPPERQVVLRSEATERVKAFHATLRNSITLEFRDMQMKTLMNFVSEVTGVTIVVDRSLANKRVTVNVKYESVDEALRDCARLVGGHMRLHADRVLIRPT